MTREVHGELGGHEVLAHLEDADQATAVCSCGHTRGAHLHEKSGHRLVTGACGMRTGRAGRLCGCDLFVWTQDQSRFWGRLTLPHHDGDAA